MNSDKVSETMAQEKAQVPGEELEAWVKQQLAKAVQELTEKKLVESIVVEAKPAWVLPFVLLIGKIREQGRTDGFDWFIYGDAPTTVALSRVAVTPRDAARHFALQWHLEAGRRGEAGAELTRRAEALHELVEEDSLWQSID